MPISANGQQPGVAHMSASGNFVCALRLARIIVTHSEKSRSDGA
jgi:hypothetical protein